MRSPVCIARHKEFDERFNAIEAWRNRLIGIVMILNIAMVIFLDKIKGFFTSP